MSANAQDIIRIAREFAEEAYWDLQVAKKLIKNLKLDNCNNNDEVFYIGRRVLYMLQQASEKVAKAFLLAYFRSWIEPVSSIVDKIENEYPTISHIQDKLKKLSYNLNPKEIGHTPHKVFLNIFCDFYEAFLKDKNLTKEYMQFFIEESLQRLSEGISSSLEKHGHEISSNTLMVKILKYSIKDITKVIEIKSLVDLFLMQELSEHTRQAVEDMCKKKKIIELPLPCINIRMLEILKPFKENCQQRLSYMKNEVNKLCKQFNKPTIESLLAKIATEIGNISDDRILKLIESNVETFYKNLLNIYFTIIVFSDYLFAYLFTVYPCLAKYEEIGRYPESITKNRELICQDIEKLKLIEEEVEFLVNIIKDRVEAIQ
jgi:hypothetical protein